MRNEDCAITLGSDRVDFLLFAANDGAHPQFEIAYVLWGIAQLHLHLHLFCGAVKPCCILVQLPPEPYVGADNWTLFTYEVDRGRCFHTLLGDEIGANDGSAPADAHYTMDLCSASVD